MAACHKVCIDGRNSQRLKHHAGKIGWEAWKEMRVVGIDADVMAYGAILRLCAARGQPEKCLGLIEEMHRFDHVKPTTLIYTAALTAVARSFRSAIRFGRADRDSLRREVAAHHGAMASRIVVLAEQAEVDQDAGFVRALMLACGAAGDGASAKAVYLASRVRNRRELYSVNRGLLGDGLSEHLPATRQEDKERDSRQLAALLTACAQTVEGPAALWTDNGGFLCPYAHISVLERPKPNYIKRRPPVGVTHEDSAVGAMNFDMDDLKDRGTGRLELKQKWKGISNVDNVDSLGDMDMWRELEKELNLEEKEDMQQLAMRKQEQQLALASEGDFAESDDRDEDRVDLLSLFPTPAEAPAELREQFEEFLPLWKQMRDSADVGEAEDDLSENGAWENFLFLQEDEQDQNEENEDEEPKEEETFEYVARKDASPSMIQEYAAFLSEWKGETQKMGYSESDIDEDETWDLFLHLRDSAKKSLDLEQGGWGDESEEVGHGDDLIGDLKAQERNDRRKAREEAVREVLSELSREMLLSERENEGEEEIAREVDEQDRATMNEDGVFQNDGNDGRYRLHNENDILGEEQFATKLDEDGVITFDGDDTLHGATIGEAAGLVDRTNGEKKFPSGVDPTSDMSAVSPEAPVETLQQWLSPEEIEYKKFELTLPTGLPRSRILKIKKAFDVRPAAPSLLTLLPHLRERLPAVVKIGKLKRQNCEVADFVMGLAEESGVVDEHICNGRLEVETINGGLDSALELYEEGFGKYGLVPNGYSDRLMIQMLVKNRRFTRALAFKEKVETSHNRILDLPSYGSLIEYCANRRQVGNAILLLRECLALHGEKPGEKSLAMLRKVCRKELCGEVVGLEDLIGPDPLDWLRHGQKHLKRDKSKVGRRGLQEGMSRLTKI
uniref:PROP1-like PPR domain-containing protein n=1 Tax=Corethron hystrix TaxID=216773 RepID=A0A7S1FQ00_9STRA